MLQTIITNYAKKNHNFKIMIFSGWGQKSDVINISSVSSNNIEYIDYLSFPSIGLVADIVKDKNPDIIIGWSLGGQIAINCILKELITTKLLILLGVPFQFLSQNSYQIGINNKIYQAFCNDLFKNPKNLLKKFHLMMIQGDKRFSDLKNKTFYSQNFNNLQYWLDYLVSFSGFDINFNNLCQTELIYGKNDNIVNYRQGKLFHKYIPNSNLSIIDNYSHILF